MKKYRIIIIENDDDERFFMCEAFGKSEQFELLKSFRNGDELIEWIGSGDMQRPDLILTDLNMPGKNGYDIIEFLRKDPALSDLIIFVTSTSSTSASVQKSMSMGANGYMVKPDIFIEYAPFIAELAEKMGQLV